MNSNFICLTWAPYKHTLQTCVARSLTSINPGLVLLKLKYFIFWYGLLSFLSCVLHVHRKKGLFVANLSVNSCSLFDQSNYSIILFCHENLYLHRSKLLVPARRIIKAKHIFTRRFLLFCNVAGIIEKDWQLISLFKNIRDSAIMLIL